MSRGTVVVVQVGLWVVAYLGMVLGMVFSASMVGVPPGPGVPPGVWAIGAHAVGLGCAYGAGRVRKEVRR